jgi:two-component system response regulator (stage 0 sporulation protein F)
MTPSILISDDDDAVRGLLRAVLEAEVYEVTEAANGRQGLNQYRLKPTDLGITDVHMPEMNGLVMLRELMPEFLDAKVIVLSGAGEKENPLDVATCLEARQTVPKPLNMAELLHAVRYELGH